MVFVVHFLLKSTIIHKVVVHPFVIGGMIISGIESYIQKFENHVARLSRPLIDLIVIPTMDTKYMGYKNEELTKLRREPRA